MNDRFKFRIFLKAHNQMCNVHTLHTGTNKVIISTRYGNSSVQINDYNILMQCTGLKDKNGKLIYESDIVEFKYEVFGRPKQIIWDECHYILKDTFIILCNTEIEQFGLKVIGNAYENPELLSY